MQPRLLVIPGLDGDPGPAHFAPPLPRAGARPDPPVRLRLVPTPARLVGAAWAARVALARRSTRKSPPGDLATHRCARSSWARLPKGHPPGVPDPAGPAPAGL